MRNARRDHIYVIVYYDSTGIGGDAQSVVRNLDAAGLEYGVIDCAYVTSAAGLCRIDRPAVLIIDASVAVTRRTLLIGYSLAMSYPIILLGAQSEDDRQLIDGTEKAGICSAAEVIGKLAELGRWLDRSVLSQSASTFFSSVDPDESVAIVCAEIPMDLRPFYGRPDHRDFLRYATFADIDALIQLMVWFAASKHRTVWAYTSNALPENALTSHLMIVGGPAWNTMADIVYEQVGLPVQHVDGGEGSPDPLREIATGEIWAPELGPAGDIRSDVGFVAQVPSPFHSDRTVTLFGGVLTHGVEASVKLCTADHVWDANTRVIDPLRHSPNEGFCIVFRCRVVANSNMAPDLTKPGALLAAYVFREGNFTRVNIA